ncbi:hypothetical protein GpSGHVEth062 [Glossina pallidipes salivary gland hypertrophy virus]|uniref:Uncharacterized protein n=1 Tax=Glossina hytrovirus (isolate Glossina pallidipes/Ethiopia/Seibersdorf/-) TaxID=379529 RepID=A0A0Y0KBF0_GHVS|nr:hypothetical protein GpSGHVEth062 [Glossina pallidipes salivary gland hypertrophy virus]
MTHTGTFEYFFTIMSRLSTHYQKWQNFVQIEFTCKSRIRESRSHSLARYKLKIL